MILINDNLSERLRNAMDDQLFNGIFDRLEFRSYHIVRSKLRYEMDDRIGTKMAALINDKLYYTSSYLQLLKIN